MTGTLYVVATPIGNLDDLSPRALRVLRQAARIACEDTRRTARLLGRHGIETPTVSCHRFNERSRVEPVLRLLREGHDVAIVSDGGTPGVSDPGALLVREARGEGIIVSPIPGPSAVSTILSVAGLVADRFVFDGFLPHREGERRRRLRELASERRTVVVFEAPHRIVATLKDAAEILGDRYVVLGRELTKIHETVLSGRPAEIVAALGRGTVRGEIVLAIEGAGDTGSAAGGSASEVRLREVWRRALADTGGDRRRALARAARELGLKRAELYRRISELAEGPGETG